LFPKKTEGVQLAKKGVAGSICFEFEGKKVNLGETLMGNRARLRFFNVSFTISSYTTGILKMNNKFIPRRLRVLPPPTLSLHPPLHNR